MLVILGLLTGGILAGQSLIRASELRAVSAQYSGYRSAMNAFRDRYFELPGDFRKATSYWTSAGGSGADAVCFAAQGSSAATCNGDGDGEIADAAGDGYIERFMAWKHLANAGLIEGAYIGKSAGVVNSYVPGIGSNVPAAKINRAFFDLLYMVPQPYIFTGSQVNRNTISLYGFSGLLGGVLRPDEAWNMDTKFDDGSPVTGSFFTFTRSSAPCPTSDANDAAYDFSVTSSNCVLNMGL